VSKDIKPLSSLSHNSFSEKAKLSKECSDLRSLLKVQLARAEDLLATLPTTYLRANVVHALTEAASCGSGLAANMNGRKLYVIQWKCVISGKVGTGCIPLGQQEADRLAAELNRDATGLHHEAVCPPVDVRQRDGKHPSISLASSRG
jgi:hypothetical protein